MIGSIVTGIVSAIHTEFGDGYPIYTETAEQGLTEPCFSVFCISPTQKQVLGQRYFRQHLFCVNYFPSPVEESKAECYAVFERLLSILECITAGGDLIRGTNMEGRIEDDVLVFHVNYNFFVHSVPTPDTPMSEMDVTERVAQDEENG